ncbi:hypothetical protein LguiB_025213 [Lonicera macranthoides]
MMDPSPGNNRQNHQPPLLNPNTTTSENENNTSTSRHNNGQRPRGLQKFRDILLMIIADKATPSQKSLVAKRFDEFFSDLHIPDHPPYAEMIQRAIRELNEAGGSNEEAISKFIREKYNDLPLAHVSMLKRHLKKLCQAGEIVVTGNQTYLLYHGNLIHIPWPGPGPGPGPSPSSSFSLTHSSSSSPSPKRKQTKRKSRRKRSRRRGRSLKKSDIDYGVSEECNEQQKQGKEVNKKQNEPEEQDDERITSEGQEQDDIDPERPPGFEHVTITEALDSQYHGGPQLPAGRGRGCGQGRGRLPMKHQSRYRGRGRQRKLNFGV